MKGKKYRYKGESLTVGEWAKRIGVSPAVLGMRLHTGWSVARALTEPVIPRARKKSSKSAKKTGGRVKTAPVSVEKVPEPAKRRRGRPPKVAAAVPPPKPEEPTRAKDGAPEAAVGEQQGIPVPKRPISTNKDFLRGMAEGIWLTISSVAMMMAESGDNVAAKNLKRVEDMFKGGFAEKFMAAVSDKKKGK